MIPLIYVLIGQIFPKTADLPTVYDGLRIPEAISSLPLSLLCLSDGVQMMHQGIRNSLGDASRHHQGEKG